MKRLLRRAVSALFLGAVLLTACASSAPSIHVQERRVSLRVSKTYHADMAFNQMEREQIIRAINKLNDQANGFVFVSVIFDLNWDSGTIDHLEFMEKNADQIVKIHSSAPIVSEMDKGKTEGTTIGYCKVDFKNPNVPTKIYIIYDRIHTKDSYMHVVLHEILHSIRLHHVDDKKAILNWSVNSARTSVCMNMNDMKELCRVYRCDPTALNYCD